MGQEIRNKNKKVHEIKVAVSGYFDPLHIGHINLFNGAKKLGNKLIVIVNNDCQAKLKKGKAFMPAKERIAIIKELKMVDSVVQAIDRDRTVIKTLQKIKPNIFANGGDRNTGNIPETEICNKLNIKMINNVGGKKAQSSSWLIWQMNKE